MAAPRKLPHVEVTWRDAYLQTEAVALANVMDKARLTTRKTTGYLCHDCVTLGCTAELHEPVVVIAMTSDEKETTEGEDQVDDIYTIPRPWVTKLRYLTGKPRKKKETPA